MKTLQINSRRIAYELVGRGAATVVLETGLGAESAEWSPVAAALAEHARVLSYDRAGRGASDPVREPRSIRVMLDDLNALIDATGAPAPFVVVGHSFGGILARAFVRERRDETSGLVLVESMHPRQFDLIGPLFPAPAQDDAKALDDMRAFWQNTWKSTDSTPEHIDFARAFEQDEIEAGSLSELPVRVLSAGSYLAAAFIEDQHIRETMQAQWNVLQGELCELSNATEHVYLEQSGHFVQRDQPDAITHAVLGLLAQD